ncbi:MAG: hypothetical protein ABI813_13020 [Bacteroidota bacterium]
MAKTNFKYLMIVHLAAIVLLGILYAVVDKDGRYLVKWLLVALIGSTILQLVLWQIKASWFGPKTRKHPDLP